MTNALDPAANTGRVTSTTTPRSLPMLNNDVLRRVRYALNLNDSAMIEIFGLAGLQVRKEDVQRFLRRDDEVGFLELDDDHLNAFLSGLITLKRGKRESPPDRPTSRQARLTNNAILRQLKIALSLKDDDMIRILSRAEFQLSKGELSSLFRQPGHRNYRECGDQILRNFLQGLAIELRGQG